MTEAHRFVWVQGNHDPTPPVGLGGAWVGNHTAGPMVFRHEAIASAEPGEIVGHHHPKAHIQARTGSVSRPCFVADARRLMMPAFGAYTGGLDVRDPRSAVCFRAAGGCFCWARTDCSASSSAGRVHRGLVDPVRLTSRRRSRILHRMVPGGAGLNVFLQSNSLGRFRLRPT